VTDHLDLTLRIVRHQTTHWMPFNLLLAFIPLPLAASVFARGWRTRVVTGGLVLATFCGLVVARGGELANVKVQVLGVVVLFTAALLVAVRGRPRNPVWWVGLVLFVLFLPNAAYVLTDGLHLTRALREVDADWPAPLLLVAPYALYTLLGVTSYGLSVWWAYDWARERSSPRVAAAGLAVLTVLVAGAIYIGRIEQIHSWAVFTEPAQVLEVLGRQADEPAVWGFVVGSLAVVGGLTAAAWLVRRWTVGRSPGANALALVFGALATYGMVVVLASYVITGAPWGERQGWAVVAACAFGALVAGALAGRTWRAALSGAPVCIAFAVCLTVTYFAVDQAQRDIVPGRVEIARELERALGPAVG
jgi:uncharacterized membrane protein